MVLLGMTPYSLVPMWETKHEHSMNINRRLGYKLGMWDKSVNN